MKVSNMVRKLETELTELEATFNRRMQFIDQFPGGYRVSGQVVYSSDVWPMLDEGAYVDETVNKIAPRISEIRSTLNTIARMI